MDFLNFRGSVVASTGDDEIVIALFDGLPTPFVGFDTCVCMLRCSRETFEALCSTDELGTSGPPGTE